MSKALNNLLNVWTLGLAIALTAGVGCQSNLDLEQRVDRALDGAPFGAPELPGAIVLIAEGEDIVVTKVYGVARYGESAAPDPGGASRAASITKSFVATLVLQLAAEGSLPLSTELASLDLGLEGLDGVTVEQALAMTSGLHDLVDDELIEMVFAQPDRAWTDYELAERGLAQPPDFAPGEGWGYSNTNYHVLALALEKVTGVALPELISERITTPLGLGDTRLPAAGDGQIAAPALVGFLGQDVSAIDPSYAGAAGAMIATGPDLIAWSRALAQGTLVAPEFAPETQPFSDGSAVGVPLAYGYGLMRIGDWLGHSGDMLGYTAAAFHLPERDFTVVVMTSGDPGSSLFMFFRVADAIASGSVPF